MLFRVVLGIVIAIVGFLMVWKTEPLFNATGRIDWAEEKLGPGGTRTFIKVGGVIVVLIGLSVMSGLIDDVLGGVAGFLIPSKKS